MHFSNFRLMRTPGLPDINEVVSGEALLNSYNNFRKQTLLRYLDEASPDLKAKILDWKHIFRSNLSL